MEPIAGGCRVGLAVAVANVDRGVLASQLTSPPEEQWARAFRDGSNGGFQGNLLPRSAATTQHKKRGCASFSAGGAQRSQKKPQRADAGFREALRRAVCGEAAGGIVDYGAARPSLTRLARTPASPRFPAQRHSPNSERTELAGADAIVAQGAEAGGRRGASGSHQAQQQLVVGHLPTISSCRSSRLTGSPIRAESRQH